MQIQLLRRNLAFPIAPDNLRYDISVTKMTYQVCFCKARKGLILSASSNILKELSIFHCTKIFA